MFRCLICRHIKSEIPLQQGRHRFVKHHTDCFGTIIIAVFKPIPRDIRTGMTVEAEKKDGRDYQHFLHRRNKSAEGYSCVQRGQGRTDHAD